MSGWNLPPGVSGNEYEIAGADAEGDADEPCPSCRAPLGWESYQGQRRLWCPECDYLGEWTFDEPDDGDRAYDALKDEGLL